MSNKTPFELRFEIFQVARDQLESQFHIDRSSLEMKYDWETAAGKNPEVPAFPEYPTFSEISEYASRINGFVSTSN